MLLPAASADTHALAAPPHTRHVSTSTSWPPRGVATVSPRGPGAVTDLHDLLPAHIAPPGAVRTAAALAASDAHTSGPRTPTIFGRCFRLAAPRDPFAHPGRSPSRLTHPQTSAEQARTRARCRTHLPLTPCPPSNLLRASTAREPATCAWGKATARKRGSGQSQAYEGHYVHGYSLGSAGPTSLKNALV